jgi:GNAT superfamily N-acetyltransferase
LSALAESKPRIEKLQATHDVSGFDCGVEPLNRFLRVHALTNQRADSAQTYVAMIEEIIAGFHSLTVGNVTYSDAPDRLAKGMPRHPVPVLIIGRFAVDRRFHGKGLGSGLLLDALRRTKMVSEIAGVRGVVVHAKDDAAKAFYEHFGFTSFPDNPRTLFRLLKDIRLDLL